MAKIKRLARTKVGNYTIDTSEVDGMCETAIKLDNGDYVIVQKYISPAHAKVGHKYWVGFCADEPISAYDVSERRAKLF